MADDERSDPPRGEALAAAGRRLNRAIRVFAGDDDLAESAAAGLDEIAALLEGHGVEGPFMQGAVNMEAMSFDRLFDDDPHTIFPYSPVIGARNPLSPPMRMRVSDDGEVHAEVTLEAQYAGPPGSVHGGVIALLFDELLGVTGVVNRSGAHTGTLEVVYRRLTPQGSLLRMRSWIDRVDGRKVYIKGELRDGDDLCAEAAGIFVRPNTDFLD